MLCAFILYRILHRVMWDAVAIQNEYVLKLTLSFHAIGSKLWVIHFGHEGFWIYHLQCVSQFTNINLGHKMYSYQWPSGTNTITDASTIANTDKAVLFHLQIKSSRVQSQRLWTLVLDVSRTNHLLAERDLMHSMSAWLRLTCILVLVYRSVTLLHILTSYSPTLSKDVPPCYSLAASCASLGCTEPSGATVTPTHPTPLCFITWIRQNYIFNLI